MARIRTIKPEFFTSDDICALSPLARLLYIGLWCESDREGRLEWRTGGFKRRYLPDDTVDIAVLCCELIDRGLVVLYGDGLAYIPQFGKHQNINPRESASILPEPDASSTRHPRVHHASSTRGDATVTHSGEGKGREGKEEKTLSASADDSSPEQQDHDGEQVTRVIPVKAILAAYAEHLPMLPQVRVMTDPRKRKLKARWCEDVERQTVDWWTRYFGYVANSPFLTGSDGRWTGCDFEWLIESGNLVKVIEGKYDNRGAGA